MWCRRSLDPVWLWCRPAAVVPIGPLAWEPPYAMGAALKIKKKDIGTPVFIAALFIISKTWEQPECPLTEEWIKKMRYIYAME